MTAPMLLITRRRMTIIALLTLGSLTLQAGGNPFGDHKAPATADVIIDDLVIEPVQLAKLPRKLFKVRHVGETGQPKREALFALFAVFQTQYTLDAADKIIPAAPWTGTSIATLSTTLRQDAVEGLFLLGGSPANCAILKLTATEPPALGKKLTLLACQSGVQTWVDPQGVEQKSPLFLELALPLKTATPRPPSRDQFIAALRAGQKFDLLVKENDALVIQAVEW